MTTTTICPFCSARLAWERPDGKLRFRCGTVGPTADGEYMTGTECDLSSCRAAYSRCCDLLVRVLDSGTSMAFQEDGWIIPKTLIDEIREEVEEE